MRPIHHAVAIEDVPTCMYKMRNRCVPDAVTDTVTESASDEVQVSYF